ncbi:methyl-accepting chemotaxis protein [Meiothermus granaticius]|uniref:Frizzy aggregation protein FrzCD n=1 Tax=Meiothermus granaticius NBRC 107808 TaxID=1227551 RepID=A0A399F6X2_9DEIN|nr:methyl-accepting chemotaxis protein [Meiothermus granaticius]MCL6525889.1 methyl-accepting chemotaxis protein [Thermaceae bacterium]RIH91843.1 Frizzy aggregation protein FrzCD [Meiothermus granaticius NBRC 107808]GEM85644.1 hypothetical protein MGR01S_02690 [Meiothermus granaticius NBRC 107808]
MQPSFKAVSRSNRRDTQILQDQGRWLDNLRLTGKIGLIVLVFTLAIFVVVFASLGGFRALRYQLDGLYNYTLVPISAINKSDAALADLVRYIELMRSPGATPGERSAYLSLAKAADAAGGDVLEEYQKSWQSSLRPGFSQVLQNRGQGALQAQEAQLLNALDQVHQSASKSLVGFLTSIQGGKPDLKLGQLAAEQYLRVRGFLQDLIVLNDQFAKISDDVARDAFAQVTRAMWIASGAALVLGLLLAGWIARATTRRLAQLERGAQSLRQGNLDFRVEVSGRDEIGTIARTFNNSVTQLREFQLQQEAERQRGIQLQDHVSRFLKIVTEIASGDLTRRGEVTEDVLGNVVDAVNLTVEEIAQLLRQVQGAAGSVTQSATQMYALTQRIAEEAQAQAGGVAQVRGQVQVVSKDIREMAERAGSSAEAAQQTLEMARLGREAVTQAMIGMNEIRAEIVRIAETIALLNTRSEQIEGIAKTLEEFASQTNLLALSAAFEAAGAGAAGRRFAVVAEEIRKLAEESARETQQVGTLVRQVQSDIQTVVAQTQEGLREAETGYRIADTAGMRLQGIAKLAETSAALAGQISTLAQAQVPVVQAVEATVQRIAQVAESVERESAQGQQTAAALQQLAGSLSQSLGRFKLPA